MSRTRKLLNELREMQWTAAANGSGVEGSQVNLSIMLAIMEQERRASKPERQRGEHKR